ncbi:MAG: GDP-mannose 4,6-dehydratase, partial [Pirellulales bacterium]|nr:GDP-mannose 4,6-dehydratase [Pirellulales bacterium]
DGTCIRDYVHIEDLASAHLSALNQLQAGEGICLNLGTGRGYSVLEVIEACRKVTGHEIPAILGERRSGDPAKLIADASRAREQLSWKPKYNDIESIVETAWRWHQAHPTGYDK